VGPISGIAGPLVAGLVVDAFGWNSIMWPIVGAGSAALLVAVLTVPISAREHRIDGAQRREIMRRFDWVGVVLFSLAACAVVVYASSRPITGRAPFTDFRLLAAFLVTSVLFVLRERRVGNPYVRLGIFRNRDFSIASVCVGVRMSLMGGVNVLVPIMVRDLYDFSSSRIGVLLVLHSVTLLSTMRLGGVLADRYRSRIQVSVGLTIQAAAMALLMLSPGQNDVIWPYIALAIHGLGAGLSLATLHLFALTTVGTDAAATASGLYSMVRFAGSTLGTAVGGVLLQSGIQRLGIIQAAYTPLFVFYSVVGILAAGLALLLSASIPDR
jgi:predicted MFS family arabinose efflux permease